MSKGSPAKIMQEKFARAVVSGMSLKAAAKSAGYSEKTSTSDIRNNPDVDKRIKEILDEEGATDRWLAKNYVEGVDLALHGEEVDINGAAQMLKQVGYLRGHGKQQQPSVAVQINNNPRTSGSTELGSASQLLAEVRDTLDIIRKELQNRGVSQGVHLRSIEDGDTQTHTDMAQIVERPEDAGRGGS